MTTLLLALFLGGAPGTLQPDASLAAEVRGLLGRQDFVAALEVLDAAAGGAHPALLRLRAEAQVGLLDYPAAVATLEGAPQEAETLALRVRLLAMLGRDEEARTVLAARPSLAARLPEESLLELAAQLRESGLVAESRRVLGPRTPGDSPVRTLERGRLRLAEDDYRGALPFLESAASAAGPPAGAAFELGRALALLGRREEAVRWLRRAVADSPADRAARFRLGQLLVQDPDPTRVAEGERLLSGHEAHRLRERRRALLLTMVTAEAPASSAGSGANRDLWVQLTGLLLDGAERDSDERTEAARVLAAAMARFPGDSVFRIGRARLLLAGGDPTAAGGLLAALVPGGGAPLSGASLSAARWLAEARLRSGDAEAAAVLFDRVLAAGGPAISARVESAAATAFALSGDPARALALFDRVLDRTAGPARAAPLADSALALEMLGRPAEAESRYRAALDAEPAHVPASIGLVELLAADGRTGAAESVLRAALARSPENEPLRSLLTRMARPPPG